MASESRGGRCIAVMAKQPRAGHVKTRLAADLGDDAVCKLCRAFLQDTLQHLPPTPDADHALYYSPAEGADYFRELDGQALLLAQPSTDFGERVRFGFERLFQKGYSRVILIGSDTPHLSQASIENALAALDSCDLVLGPCSDGGYFLIGLNGPAPGLFTDIPWSTDRVLEVTRARASQLGLRVLELPQSFDVDDLGGLQHLKALIEGHPELCPATAQQIECCK